MTALDLTQILQAWKLKNCIYQEWPGKGKKVKYGSTG